MTKVAYIRVSSEKQNTIRQRKALNEIGCTVFYEEKVSGKNTERSELQRVLRRYRKEIQL